MNTPRIHGYISKTTFLNFEDSLQIGKLKLFAGKYQNGHGAEVTLTHYLDTDAARPILHDMLWAKAIDAKDYKGSTKDGRTTSRVLYINTAEKGYYFELVSGPGKETNTGAVMPAGNADAAVNVFIPFHFARQIAANILEYFAARRFVALMYSYDTSLLTGDVEPAREIDATAINDEDEPAPPARTARTDEPAPPPPAAENELDKWFPREPEPEQPALEAGALIHQFKYGDNTTAPNDSRSRAIFQAYYNEHHHVPKSSRALKAWWTKNKPK